MKPFFVYMLRCSDGSYYIGHTDELERRVESRLRADPALTSLRVRTEGGQIKLCGRVRDEDERKRALSLAEEAAGAGKVIDGSEGP